MEQESTPEVPEYIRAQYSAVTDRTHENRDRLTVLNKVYHSTRGQSPRLFDHGYSVPLLGEEHQPYERQGYAIESWEHLDLGWMNNENAGLLVIINNEGKFLDRYPTDEERENSAKRVLELGYSNSSPRWLIPPQCQMQAWPSEIEDLCIRSSFEQARFTLLVFPK